MPLATNPNATYKIVLSTDTYLPEEERPVFIFRYLSATEWQQITKLSDKFDQLSNTEKMLNLAFEVIEKIMVGWEKMIMPDGKKIPFDLAKLQSMVTLQEATELMQAAISQRPNIDDKKKFTLPLESSMDSSASAKTAKAKRNVNINRHKKHR